MTRQLIAVTNTTVVNTETMCELLRKIAGLGLTGPLTLVLDNARYQRNAAVQALVNAHTEGRQFGFFGEPRVNVLLLNIALDSASPRRTSPAVTSSSSSPQ